MVNAFSSLNIIIPYNTHSLGKIQKLLELKSKQRILETLEFGEFVFIICIAISIVGIRSASDERIIGAGPISEFTSPQVSRKQLDCERDTYLTTADDC